MPLTWYCFYISNPTNMGYWPSTRSKWLDICQEWGQYPTLLYTLVGVYLNLTHAVIGWFMATWQWLNLNVTQQVTIISNCTYVTRSPINQRLLWLLLAFAPNYSCIFNKTDFIDWPHGKQLALFPLDPQCSPRLHKNSLFALGSVIKCLLEILKYRFVLKKGSKRQLHDRNVS